MRAKIAAVGLVVAALAGMARAADKAVSTDGRYAVSIWQIGKGDENGSGAQALVLSATTGGAQRRLLVSRYNEDYAQNLANISNPLFSLDGGYVYFSTNDASPNSGYVHQFDLKLNRIRHVCVGQALKVMRTGPYRGWLLVQKHRYWNRPEGGSYNPVFLVKPDGAEVMMVPGSANDDGELAIDPWLAKNGWRAW